MEIFSHFKNYKSELKNTHSLEACVSRCPDGIYDPDYKTRTAKEYLYQEYAKEGNNLCYGLKIVFFFKQGNFIYKWLTKNLNVTLENFLWFAIPTLNISKVKK